MDKFPNDDARAPYSTLSGFEERLLSQGYCLADVQQIRDELKAENLSE